MNDQLAKPPSESELRRVRREVSQLHPGNRFRLMFGQSLLPQDELMPILPEPVKPPLKSEKPA